MSSQKNFNALIEENLLKIDELARNVDRIFLGITIIIRGITRKRPRIKITYIRVITKIVPTNKIHIHRFIIILNQGRQRHIIGVTPG